MCSRSKQQDLGMFSRSNRSTPVQTRERERKRETATERERGRERAVTRRSTSSTFLQPLEDKPPFLPSATTAMASSFMESWSAAPHCTVPSMEQSRSEIGVGRLPSCTAGVRMDSHIRPSILHRGPRCLVCLIEESLGNVCECM